MSRAKDKIKDNLKEKSKKAGNKPGVYFWLAKNNKIIYIGRANRLRQRLNNYWQKNVDPKTKEVINQAVDLKYYQTNNILESIILEAKEIKKHWPIYNIKDKDNRSFIYIIIDYKTDFPSLKLIRENDLKKIERSNFKIFGPYQSYKLISQVIKIIRPIFPYSTCKAFSNQACFDRQIGLCPGTCLGEISSKDYKKNIKSITLLLAGQKEKLINKLSKENPEAIKALKHIQDVSLLERELNISNNPFKKLEAYDISHWQGKNSYGAMVVMENNKLKKSDYRLFKIKEAPASDDERALLEILQRRLKHKEWILPEIIIIDGGYPQISFINKHLEEELNNIIIIGISKYKKDQIIFSKKTNKETQNSIQLLKDNLLLLRDEAHRFANMARKRKEKEMI